LKNPWSTTTGWVQRDRQSATGCGGSDYFNSLLIDTYLTDIPLARLYDGQTSIYDLAMAAFGGTIMLREHFRCVPEIIQFSNHLSYDGQIKPLREASNVSIKPHVVAHRVEGWTSLRNVNEEEGHEIAALVIAAGEQSEYAGKTFGVISLVGNDQAIWIDRLLRQHLDPVEYERRRLRCGNPAQFQGDERDVIWLSMVDSPGNGPLALRAEGPREMYKKRYNVAASRARDQLWVVHSLDAFTDLKPGDMRRRLLEFALDLQSLTREIQAVQAQAESEFERQVLDGSYGPAIACSLNTGSVTTASTWWWKEATSASPSSATATSITTHRSRSRAIWSGRLS
jgi:hypothetical protein